MRVPPARKYLNLLFVLFAAIVLAGCQTPMAESYYSQSMYGDATGSLGGGEESPAAEPTTLATVADAVVIPPHSRVEWTIRGSCLDPDRAAPRAGDSFRLERIDELIDPRLKPVYQGYINLAARDPEAKRYEQQIVWAMRMIDKKRSYASNLGQRQLQLLDRSYPGGAELFQSVHLSRAGKSHPLDIVSGVLGAFGIPIDLAALLTPDTAPEIADAQLQELIDKEPEPLKGSGYGYSEITDGVQAEIKGVDTLTLRVSVTNTTASEFRFIPSAYAAVPKRHVQRVSMNMPASVTVGKI